MTERQLRAAVVVVGLAILAVSASAAAAPQPAPALSRVLVLDLQASGVEAAVAKGLSDVFALAIRQALSGAAVYGQSDINAMLAMEKQRDVVGCSEDISCLAELGGALGADHLAFGAVSKIGDVHLLTLKLVRTSDATTIRHVSEEVPGEAQRLIAATRQWGTRLVDPDAPAPVGYLDVSGEGPVTIDGGAPEPTPIVKRALAPGNHSVVFGAGTAARLEKRVALPAYATVAVDDAPPVPLASVQASRAASVPHGRRGTFAQLGGGMSTLTITEGFAAPTGWTYGARVGYVTEAGWTLGLAASDVRTREGSDASYAHAGRAAIEIGHLSDARLTISPTLAVGYGWADMLKNTEGSDIAPFTQRDGYGVFLATSLTARLRVTSMLDVGLNVEHGGVPPLFFAAAEDTPYLALRAAAFLELHPALAIPADAVTDATPFGFWAAWGIGTAALAVTAIMVNIGENDDSQQTIGL